MTFKTLAAATLIAASVTPVFAADEFYVVQDAKTKHCTIVDKKPVDTTTTVGARPAQSTRPARKPKPG